MKKIISLGLVLCLIASFFVGCKKQSSKDPEYVAMSFVKMVLYNDEEYAKLNNLDMQQLILDNFGLTSEFSKEFEELKQQFQELGIEFDEKYFEKAYEQGENIRKKLLEKTTTKINYIKGDSKTKDVEIGIKTIDMKLFSENLLKELQPKLNTLLEKIVNQIQDEPEFDINNIEQAQEYFKNTMSKMFKTIFDEILPIMIETMNAAIEQTPMGENEFLVNFKLDKVDGKWIVKDTKATFEKISKQFLEQVQKYVAEGFKNIPGFENILDI